MSLFNSISHDHPSALPLYRRLRWRIFLVVLLSITLVGGIFVYSRTPIYRAVTTVLTQQPKDLSLFGAQSDTENLAIQERQLLSEALQRNLLDDLRPRHPTLDMASLQRMLRVKPIAGTNLLDISADGSQPTLLADLVNTWASAYESYRSDQIQQASGRTSRELEDQQKQLLAHIDKARADLNNFRREHQIVGLKPGDNQALAGLRGLNQSLNKAREKLIDAKARQTALKEALKRGESIVPDAMRKDIAAMRLKLQRDQLRLDQLKQRFTMLYIESDPTLKELPGQVRQEKRELAASLKRARQTMLQDTNSAVTEASTAVQELQSQLNTQQEQVQQFNDNYQQLTTLQDKLTQLESLLSSNQQQLAQIQITNLRKFPPIQIVNPAGVPTTPISPHYRRDMGIVLGIAFLVALFATWLVEYLNGRQGNRDKLPRIDLNIYPSGQVLPGSPQPTHTPLRASPPQSALDAPAPGLPLLKREVTAEEISKLLLQAQPEEAASIALLLSGVAPHELDRLDPDCFNPSQHTLSVPGEQARLLPLAAPVWQWLSPALAAGLAPAGPVAMDQRLLEMAVAQRINAPASVTTAALWHSYLLHLVRQGIGPDALAARAGQLPGELLAQLDQFNIGDESAGRIDYMHPALCP